MSGASKVQTASTKPTKRRRVKEAMAVEVEPDAWERFEQAVGKIAPPKKPSKPRYAGEHTELMAALAKWVEPAPSLTIYLFGSRGRGDHRDESDIDVFVDTMKATKKDRDWWFEENTILQTAPECSTAPEAIRSLLRASDGHNAILQAAIRSAHRTDTLRNVVCVDLHDARKPTTNR